MGPLELGEWAQVKEGKRTKAKSAKEEDMFC